MHITIMYHYYFNLHIMHVFLHLYKYYYYVLCSTIYYILLLFFHFMYRTFISAYSKTKMERIIKKYIYIFILIYFLYVEIKIHESKFYQMTLFLCIHELCDPSNPSHLTLSPFLRSTSFLTRYTSG